MLTFADLSPEIIGGLIVFIGFGCYYGLMSGDVGIGKGILISLGSNVMSLSVFGTLLTLCWLVLMPFGVKVGIPGFGKVLLQFCGASFIAFMLCYLPMRIVRGDK